MTKSGKMMKWDQIYFDFWIDILIVKIVYVKKSIMLKYLNLKNIKQKLVKLIKSYDFLKRIEIGRNFNVFIFFCFLFLILVVRLFYLQIIKSWYYEVKLSKQNINELTLKAKRWSIYAYDKAWKPIKLTENLTMYNLVVDPKFIWDKARFIELVTPVIYKHFCEMYGMENMTKVQCIQNIENYANKDLLPKLPEFFYFGSGKVSEMYYTYDMTWYQNQVDQVLQWFTTWVAYELIKNALDKKIFVWIKPQNYIWFFPDNNFVKSIKELNLPYVSIESNYFYIIPYQIKNPTRAYEIVKSVMSQFWYLEKFPNLEAKFYPQENRYVKLISGINPFIANMVRDLKSQYNTERTKDKISVLYWLWLEPYVVRYYPYWSFLSNILWYVDKNWVAYYWIEQFFDEILRGKDWYIKWRSSAWIGQVWANEFEIENARNWDDVYLTIDIWMQKEIESIVNKYHKILKADSVSVLVYEPYSWQIKASVNAPSFNPNNYNDAYQYMPLWIEYRQLVDDETYMDVPVFIKTWWQYSKATLDDRKNVDLPKYIRKNIYWSQVFVDKNISKYEPWSIFKAFTVWIWYDTDEMRFYDFYDDKWFVEIDLWTTKYRIKNADKVCLWLNTYMHAFIYSCNVWMAWIVQKIWKENFYNYLEKLWFGKQTWIELAMESEWDVRSVTNVEFSRFINNAFGQWLSATPLQIAVGYWALLNWWYYIKPTIIVWLKNPGSDTLTVNEQRSTKQVFKPETVQEIKEALFSVLDQNPELKDAKVEWYKLWWKSWTSQIAYKWRYQNWLWWTNWSFVWIITKDNVKYIIIVQVRRPRSSLRWWYTAWKVFWEVAKFLLNYSFIEK